MERSISSLRIGSSFKAIFNNLDPKARPLIEMFDALLSLDPRLTAKRRKKSYEIMVAALARLERKDA